jgi:hypothetical protein
MWTACSFRTGTSSRPTTTRRSFVWHGAGSRFATEARREHGSGSSRCLTAPHASSSRSPARLRVPPRSSRHSSPHTSAAPSPSRWRDFGRGGRPYAPGTRRSSRTRLPCWTVSVSRPGSASSRSSSSTATRVPSAASRRHSCGRVPSGVTSGRSSSVHSICRFRRPGRAACRAGRAGPKAPGARSRHSVGRGSRGSPPDAGRD